MKLNWRPFCGGVQVGHHGGDVWAYALRDGTYAIYLKGRWFADGCSSGDFASAKAQVEANVSSLDFGPDAVESWEYLSDIGESSIRFYRVESRAASIVTQSGGAAFDVIRDCCKASGVEWRSIKESGPRTIVVTLARGIDNGRLWALRKAINNAVRVTIVSVVVEGE